MPKILLPDPCTGKIIYQSYVVGLTYGHLMIRLYITIRIQCASIGRWLEITDRGALFNVQPHHHQQFVDEHLWVILGKHLHPKPLWWVILGKQQRGGNESYKCLHLWTLSCAFLKPWPWLQLVIKDLVDHCCSNDVRHIYHFVSNQITYELKGITLQELWTYCHLYCQVWRQCLQWNDFKENVHGGFGHRRYDNEFADMSLACDDGQQGGRYGVPNMELIVKIKIYAFKSYL